jgi:hypothetical protein
MPFKAEISYIVEGPFAHNGNGIAVTNDRSRHGLGLYVEQGFPVGQRMKVFSPQLAEEPILAQVRWCSEVSNSLFRIGLMLFEPVGSINPPGSLRLSNQ